MSHLAAIPYLDRPTDTNTSQIAEKGALRIHKHATLGMQVCRMVQNTSGAPIPAKLVVQFKDGSGVEVLKSAASEPTVGVAGVTVSLIPDNSYGWVVCSGVAVCTSNAAIVAGAPVATAGTLGKIDDTSITGIEHCLIGKALNAAGAANADVNVLLSGLM
tara:strand:+ start:24606 stop:25085 length:480 start_codon:yes stop_codon:yes gene_type:complete